MQVTKDIYPRATPHNADMQYEFERMRGESQEAYYMRLCVDRGLEIKAEQRKHAETVEWYKRALAARDERIAQLESEKARYQAMADAGLIVELTGVEIKYRKLVL